MLSVGTVVVGVDDLHRAVKFWTTALNYAGDSADQKAEVERLVALGATRVDWDRYPDNADFIVLADTEGNRFCVIDTSHS